MVDIKIDAAYVPLTAYCNAYVCSLDIVGPVHLGGQGQPYLPN